PRTAFDCTTVRPLGSKKETFKFTTAFLKHDKIAPELVPVAGKDGEDIYVEADESSYAFILNENLGFESGSGRLQIHGDGDGISLVDLVLFENSGYEKGYFRVTYEGAAYTEVGCKLTGP